jgi:hypothetical protein
MFNSFKKKPEVRPHYRQIVEGKLYDTENMIYIDFVVVWKETYHHGCSNPFLGNIYKSKLGQYVVEINGKLELYTSDEIKKLLEEYNRIDAYRQEFGLEEG